MRDLRIANLDEVPFAMNEALNQLRVNLSFCGAGVRCVMVTSSTPNEGKSFVTFRLWKMMAEMGMRALHMDLDLRNSALRAKYGLECDGEMRGLAHYLSGLAELGDCVYRTSVPNGYMAPIGTHVANPSLLLEGGAFREMMGLFRGQYDFVLVDTPPLGSVADALHISRYCDGTLLVIGAGSPRKLVANSVQLLERSDCPLLGTVLNRYDPRRGRSGYYYYGRYSGYGGYGYGDSAKQ